MEKRGGNSCRPPRCGRSRASGRTAYYSGRMGHEPQATCATGGPVLASRGHRVAGGPGAGSLSIWGRRAWLS